MLAKIIKRISNQKKKRVKIDIEVRAFNLSIWKAEVGGSGVRLQPGNMRLSEEREGRTKGREEGIREGGRKRRGEGKEKERKE